MRPPHHQRPLATPLREDWDRLVARRQDLAEHLGAAGFQPWARPDAAPDPIDQGNANAHLARLVALAATEPWAARVVLQRLLPGLMAMARRRCGHHPGLVYGTFDEVVATAWIVICQYPVTRRPWAVAAGLLRDVEYQAFQRPHRQRRVREVRLGGAEPHDDHPPSSFDEVVEVLVDGSAARLPTRDLALAAALANGRPLPELASEARLSVRAMRYRRAVAAGSLRRATLGWNPEEC